MYLVRCKKCGNNMKTNPVKVATSKKKCVYCGFTFQIKDAIISPKKEG